MQKASKKAGADKPSAYRRADAPLPERNRLWPLYGAGFENLGRDGRPIKVSMPRHGPDGLLARHDTCGLCFSDFKFLRAGQEHPRIYRDMKADPVVLGHEVTVNVVGVGEHLRDQYHEGDRFLVQTDIYKGGVGYAYGHELQGGLSQYTVLDDRLLDDDDGCCLMPLQPQTCYAEAALLEPWARVTAAYRLEYRSGLKPGGTTSIIGTAIGRERPYTVGVGFDEASHPDRLLLADVPPQVRPLAEGAGRSIGRDGDRSRRRCHPTGGAVGRHRRAGC